MTKQTKNLDCKTVNVKVSPESTTGKPRAQLCKELAATACLDRASSAVATFPSFFFRRREIRDNNCHSTDIKESTPCCEFFAGLGLGEGGC